MYALPVKPVPPITLSLRSKATLGKLGNAYTSLLQIDQPGCRLCLLFFRFLRSENSLKRQRNPLTPGPFIISFFFDIRRCNSRNYERRFVWRAWPRIHQKSTSVIPKLVKVVRGSLRYHLSGKRSSFAFEAPISGL
ncbi:hypothetical protein AVEN_234066-1 [Araneus ventricosus]|uniref:Uncharacterized protein n=1 Tax=Araneus ventricosus TaxID=182803 RepID=A0A4Y2LNC5_ARAVE|nr:hypothetical protein AVEN_89880-1 [Araneus ventricosus]GBN15997.1 hypothetical protein AVEN_234066-1 [Araneus ventricosus]